eukprot:TRINITY_DN2012_c0_g2_i27.p1 TRINITY_DN2012_c0_g2~~TRINITY_DN2012_c0_g2_i27.p1  ORF type:complete len:456 (-),score=76.21 TRINITY_DN2012_c0_g2_i27:1429-2796(-)
MFGCYVSLYNHSSETVLDVTLKAEIITQNKIPVLDTTDRPKVELFPNARIDFIVRQKVDEACFHLLSCVCFYSRLNGVKTSFRKLFKFPVTNPFHVDCVVYPLHNGFCVKACVTNVSKKSIFLSNVDFVSSNPQKLKSSPISATEKSVGSLDSLTYLGVSESKQYLFQLAFTDLLDPSIKETKDVGKLLLTWKGPFGETGSREYSDIVNATVYPHVLSLLILDIPPVFIIHKPFNLHFKLINRNQQPIHPFIFQTQTITVSPTPTPIPTSIPTTIPSLTPTIPTLTTYSSSGQPGNLLTSSTPQTSTPSTPIPNPTLPHHNILVVGQSTRQLEQILPGKHGHFVFTYIPIHPGLQQIPALLITDNLTNRSYRFGNLLQIFVERKSPDDNNDLPSEDNFLHPASVSVTSNGISKFYSVVNCLTREDTTNKPSGHQKNPESGLISLNLTTDTLNHSV